MPFLFLRKRNYVTETPLNPTPNAHFIAADDEMGVVKSGQLTAELPASRQGQSKVKRPDVLELTMANTSGVRQKACLFDVKNYLCGHDPERFGNPYDKVSNTGIIIDPITTNWEHILTDIESHSFVTSKFDINIREGGYAQSRHPFYHYRYSFADDSVDETRLFTPRGSRVRQYDDQYDITNIGYEIQIAQEDALCVELEPGAIIDVAIYVKKWLNVQS